MPRRVNLPGADELFRQTTKNPSQKPSDPESAGKENAEAPTSSGRVKHDEKMTIYVTSEELLAVEQARLKLRSELGKNIDRGRFVRAALALALSDFEEQSMESAVAKRLSEQ